jgi:Mn-dependent DtxR family transcriptional regulator
MAAKYTPAYLKNVVDFIRSNGEVTTNEVSKHLKNDASSVLDRLIREGKIKKVKRTAKITSSVGPFVGISCNKQINYYSIASKIT